MGYRSEIVGGFKESLLKEFKEILIENDLDKAFEFTDDDGIVFFKGDYLKWYEEFSDVKAINKFIQDNNGFLIGLGEDGAVHTEIGIPYDYDVYTVSYIKSPFNK